MILSFYFPATVDSKILRPINFLSWGNIFSFALLSAIVWVFTSCRISLIADRDEAFINRTLEIARKVDALYLQLISADTTHLQYAHYAEMWDMAELDIRQLRLMAEAHPLNTESSKICSLLLDTFMKYKVLHQRNNFYPPTLMPIHRERLSEYFIALLSIEKTKEIHHR